jgi:hypothetical protein
MPGPEATEELRGEAAGKVEVPETDFGALAEDFLNSPGDDDFVDVGDDDGQPAADQPKEGGDPGAKGEEEGQEDEVLNPDPEGETPPESVDGEGQPEGAAVPPPDMAKLRQAEVERLTSVYALSDEDARTMTVEPEKIVPKMMAEMHANIVEAVVAVLGAQLPAVVESLGEQKRARVSAEDAFYKRFPALKGEKFRKSVEESIRIARTSDPKASMQEVIIQAGILASLKHRVALPEDLMPEATVSAPAVGQAPRQKRSFVPAAPAGNAPAGAGRSRNEFESLAEEFLSEDNES